MKIKGSRRRDTNLILTFFIIIMIFSVYFFLVNNNKIEIENYFVDTTNFALTQEVLEIDSLKKDTLNIDTLAVDLMMLDTLFTIQLVTSNKNIDLNSYYFKNLVVELKHSKLDNKYRYIFGSFENEEDAEMLLDTINGLGFKDAFIRELSWYEKN